ncbi:uncharacterized protein LOC135338505 isoform X2 [Halichondria panicea]|uniref:uncharacterized protein LOC135338505 isoform X2 n=1 Tax=Halichondria panicea TaxID=6063 RepID=UPI00312B7E91
MKRTSERSDDNNNFWCVMGEAGGRRIGQCGCRKYQEVQRLSCGLQTTVERAMWFVSAVAMLVIACKVSSLMAVLSSSSRSGTVVTDEETQVSERLHSGQQPECAQSSHHQERLVEEHSKTLERVTELWKQKWPVNWDDAWEEKHVSIDLDSPSSVNQGGPAEGQLKVGDILESVNGINLDNADHREAVRAVRDEEDPQHLLTTMATFLQCMCPVPSHIFRKRKSAYPIVMGIVQSVNSVPHPPPPQVTVVNTETLEYSLYFTSKEI